jgi:WD40 repeat protein
LISQGADVNAVDNAGCMPLHHATWNMDICQYLISQGADVNAADTNGGTPLHHTIWNNSSVEVMKYLISRGADVHAKNRYGKTPLDIANTEEKKQILRNASNANPPPSTLPPTPLLPPYPYLVVTTYFNVATIWDATTGQSLCHLMHPNQILSASYSPNGKYILTECRDKLVRIWNAETGYLLHAIHARKEFANDPVPIDFSDTVSACFSTDSKCVWIKYSNGNEWLADVTTGKSAGMINKSHMSFISPSRQISHDGKFEIKPGRNHSTLICESNTGKVVCELKGHKNFVSSAAFSP